MEGFNYPKTRLLLKSFEFPLSEVERIENDANIARMKELIYYKAKK